MLEVGAPHSVELGQSGASGTPLVSSQTEPICLDGTHPENEGFYPDFILWVKGELEQRIVFVEPHGMGQE